ncbi:hypothetical protein JO84_gp080 [Aureococcus anophagefferens virus]|uniref:Uncharacterized protein n=1 Tax=Aureococcus anophagefferens virus TaxID=1474867 RepID=A0A076FMC1_9VIRU|nr:hypothetical protein JO84_gp080 [Aureococcus anophagefferens virus]AII17053.1 hypothetical protein AaV_080 [Aureococcus anophagefferens virus]UOG94380.1 hypothetical protein MKD35_345 [Aureococcus anophagefferens virus]
MNLKELLVGPLKSKKHCKYFQVINWLLVILFVWLTLTLSIVAIGNFKEFKKDLNLKSVYLYLMLILNIYVVRVMHGICLKALN